tara:strand:- start:111 stop:368 length:258 start_codon:yes stop_codon:yes gene_type:complete
MNTDKKTVQEIADYILPVVEDHLWDTINWHLSLKSTKFLNPNIKNMNDKEMFLLEFEIYKSTINKLYKEINKEANPKTWKYEQTK